MLSYQHAYHAGNLADVHKHCILLAVLRAIVKSASAVHYLESHAGRGRYDLLGSEATKTAEWQRGIGRLAQAKNLEGPLNQFRKMVLDFSRGAHTGPLRYYPGSPAIARKVLRQKDQATLHDLHPQEFGALSDGLASDKRFELIKADGLAGVFSVCSVNQAFRFALVDPSYEQRDEFQQISGWLDECSQLGSLDVVLLWYPRLTDGRHNELEEKLRRSAELSLFDFAANDPDTAAGKKMFGSGMGLVLGDQVMADKALTRALRRHMKVITKDLSQWFTA